MIKISFKTQELKSKTFLIISHARLFVRYWGEFFNPILWRGWGGRKPLWASHWLICPLRAHKKMNRALHALVSF